MENDTQLTIKLPNELKRAFHMSTKNQDKNSSQEIRKFMREYVAKHGQSKLL